jgi:ribosomal-protein-alanine N-acetyltransferase
MVDRVDGARCYIRALSVKDAPAVLDLRVANKDFFEPYEPSRQPLSFTVAAQKAQLEAGVRQWQADLGYAFGIFDIDSDEMIGRVALSNIVWSAWQNATLGYFIAEKYNGRGIATDAVRCACSFAFKEAHLHRVQAGVMPRNKGSIRVLEKVGFRHEGFSPRYLNINGVWEDHEMLALTVEEWPA